jgi:hypothetical protein
MAAFFFLLLAAIFLSDIEPLDLDPFDIEPLDIEPLDIEPSDVEPLDMDPLLCPCAKAAPANEALRKNASEVIFMELFMGTLLEVGRIARPSISLL